MFQLLEVFVANMNSDLAVAFSAFFIICKMVKNKKKLRSQWVRRLYRHRTDNLLLREMDHIHLKNFTRMTSEDFEELIKLIGPIIQKKDTKLRKAIPVKDRLALTLRFLTSGDSFTSLQYLFKISKQSISVIVTETCSALTQSCKLTTLMQRTERTLFFPSTEKFGEQ